MPGWRHCWQQKDYNFRRSYSSNSPSIGRPTAGESTAIVNEGEGFEPHEAALVRDVKQILYEKALAWIAYQRGGHNGRWPPRSVAQCVGWTVVRMLADVHEKPARAVAMDLVDYVERSEKGERQP